MISDDEPSALITIPPCRPETGLPLGYVPNKEPCAGETASIPVETDPTISDANTSDDAVIRTCPPVWSPAPGTRSLKNPDQRVFGDSASDARPLIRPRGSKTSISTEDVVEAGFVRVKPVYE